MDHYKDGIYSNTPKDIERKTGRKFSDIMDEMLEKGLTPTEIAMELKLVDRRYVTLPDYQKSVRERIQTIPAFKNVNKRRDIYLEEACLKQFNIPLKDFLYQKYIVERYSIYELSVLIGRSNTATSQLLKRNGIRKSISQARRDSMEKGLINYDSINHKVRSTKRKLKTSSKSQEIARDLFKTIIEGRLLEDNGLSDYEVVIGFNEYGILRTFEVDIPIVFINNADNSIVKVSVEYNGKLFHKDEERDLEKGSKLIKNGWHHFIIIEGSYSKTERRINEIVDEIFTLL